MTDQLISIGFGKETFKTTSASLAAFVVEPEFVRTLPSKKFKRQGSCQRFPASLYPEVNGYFYLDSITAVPDGTIILLQSSQRFNANPIRDGAIFICLRSGGPLLSIQASLPSAIESTMTDGCIAFQGRGDVLEIEDLPLYGIVPNKNYINGFTDPEEVAECYRITQLAPEMEGKPVLNAATDRDGEVVMVRQRPPRKISLRRA